MRRILFFAGSVLVVAACDRAPTGPVVQGVKAEVVKWECRSGVVIHTGRDSSCVEE